jgi:hypothetical protein
LSGPALVIYAKANANNYLPNAENLNIRGLSPEHDPKTLKFSYPYVEIMCLTPNTTSVIISATYGPRSYEDISIIKLEMSTRV